MTMPGQLDQDAVRDLLLRNWMTHDAMWFREAVTRRGIAEANAINRAAVRSMAVVEAGRIRRLIGLEAVARLEDVRAFFTAAVDLVIPAFIACEFEWESEASAVTLRVTRCFAHDGVAGLGLIDQYECGIFERIYGWLDALGVGFAAVPDTLECLLHTRGACARRLSLSLK